MPSLRAAYHAPGMMLCSVLLAISANAQGNVDSLVFDHALITHFDPDCIEENQRINRIQRPFLPKRDVIEYRIRHRADQVR
jgi:hypothetical protein